MSQFLIKFKPKTYLKFTLRILITSWLRLFQANQLLMWCYKKKKCDNEKNPKYHFLKLPIRNTNNHFLTLKIRDINIKYYTFLYNKIMYKFRKAPHFWHRRYNINVLFFIYLFIYSRVTFLNWIYSYKDIMIFTWWYNHTCTSIFAQRVGRALLTYNLCGKYVSAFLITLSSI